MEDGSHNKGNRHGWREVGSKDKFTVGIDMGLEKKEAKVDYSGYRYEWREEENEGIGLQVEK